MAGRERGAHHTAFFTEFNGHSHALSTTAAVNENGSHCLTGGSTKKEAAAQTHVQKGRLPDATAWRTVTYQ
jgi:hypothetical protein